MPRSVHSATLSMGAPILVARDMSDSFQRSRYVAGGKQRPVARPWTTGWRARRISIIAGAKSALLMAANTAGEIPNKAGALAALTAKLAKKGSNIDAVYGTVTKGAKKSVLFYATSKLTEG
jgi:hypothetical protein